MTDWTPEHTQVACAHCGEIPQDDGIVVDVLLYCRSCYASMPKECTGYSEGCECTSCRLREAHDASHSYLPLPGCRLCAECKGFRFNCNCTSCQLHVAQGTSPS